MIPQRTLEDASAWFLAGALEPEWLTIIDLSPCKNIFPTIWIIKRLLDPACVCRAGLSTVYIRVSVGTWYLPTRSSVVKVTSYILHVQIYIAKEKSKDCWLELMSQSCYLQDLLAYLSSRWSENTRTLNMSGYSYILGLHKAWCMPLFTNSCFMCYVLRMFWTIFQIRLAKQKFLASAFDHYQKRILQL